MGQGLIDDSQNNQFYNEESGMMVDGGPQQEESIQDEVPHRNRSNQQNQLPTPAPVA